MDTQNLKNKLIIFDLDNTLVFKGVNPNKLKSILKKLKRKYKLAILSNSFRWHLNRLLLKYDLNTYFDRVYSGSKIIIRKPNPYAFKQVLEDFNLNGEECIFVGDNPFTDIFGAKQFNMKTVLVKNKTILKYIFDNKYVLDKIKPDHIITNIYNLDDIL